MAREDTYTLRRDGTAPDTWDNTLKVPDRLTATLKKRGIHSAPVKFSGQTISPGLYPSGNMPQTTAYNSCFHYYAFYITLIITEG